MDSFYPARYSDGRTAAAHQVRVALDTADLTIVTEEATQIDRWPTAEIRLVGEPDDEGAVRLCRDGGDARLTIDNRDLIARLTAQARNLRRPASRAHVRGRRIALWAGGAAASVALFFFVVVPYFAHEIVRLTPAIFEARAGAAMADVVIGLLADAEPKRQGKSLCEHADGQAALRRMTAALAAPTSLAAPPVVRVVNSKHRNAFALPGGQVLVLRGIIEFASGPNEIAGVLAHELAHIEHRHPLQIAIERTSGAFVIGLLFGDAVGFSVAGTAASAMLQGYYSREMEAEADARGLALMQAAGFTTTALGEFFERLALQEPALPGIFSALSTHPDTGERAARARAARTGGGAALSAAEWQALRGICR
jgi:Zn-dependent protease with chaperone function